MSDPSLSPAAHPENSFLNQANAIAVYAQNRHNELLSQLRFMGLLCGIMGPNDIEADVEAARNSVIEALSEFLAADGGPLSEQVSQGQAGFGNNGLINSEQSRYMQLMRAGQYDEAMELESAMSPFLQQGHIGDQSNHGLGQIADGSITSAIENHIGQSNLSPESVAYLRERAVAYQRLAQLEQQRREANRAAWRQWWADIWASLRSYYDARLAEIRQGRVLEAVSKTAIDAAYIAAEELIYAGMIAAIIALTGGAAAAIGVGLRIAISVGSRSARVLARAGSNIVEAAGRQAVDLVFDIRITKVHPAPIRGQGQPGNLLHTHRVDVERDLTPDEAAAFGEGGLGTTRTDADAPEQGPSGGGANDNETPAATTAARPRRSREELLPNGEVPTGEDFNSWWNNLTPEEHDMLWSDRSIRSDIRSEVLGRGGTHEWLKRSQLNKLKELGFSMEEIKAFTAPTRLTEGPNPITGGRWRHTPEGGGRGSGPGSGDMHNSLDEIIESATSRNDLLRRYGYWANSWLDNGIDSFPPAMRDAILAAGGG